MGMRWLMILGIVSLGCSDEENIVTAGETDTVSATIGAGSGSNNGSSVGSNDTTNDSQNNVPGGRGIPTDPNASPDATAGEGTESAEGGTDTEEPKQCETGSVKGTFCDPGTLPEQSCTSLTISGQCEGESFTVSAPLAPGGAFDLKDVPVGVHTLEVSVGNIQASCSLLVEAGIEKKVIASDCECEGEESCELFSPNCWAEDYKDDCNCMDDDCDGEVDEDCVDICNCEDDNCNGVTDEDCVDICDGIDQNCNGVKDEDCPYVNQCIPEDQSTEFEDCDQNGLVDTCPTCAAAEVVFVLDTSGSMVDELEALCTGIEAIQAALNVVDIEISVEILGITETNNCATETVIDLYGNIAAEAPQTVPKLADCQSSSDSSEDWATAVAVVAANKVWADDGIKMIIPISDEAPICGNPLDNDDQHGIEAINPFVASLGVLIYPISASGTPADIIELSKSMADATGGLWNETTAPDEDLILHVLGGVFDACGKGGDCNENNTPDVCDIEAGTSTDCDGNGIPDSCTFNPEDAAMDCNANGKFDACELVDEEDYDCNANAVLDGCDIAADPALDCDKNGKIDSCEAQVDGNDCNNNNTLDICEVTADPGLDCDGNSVIDSCQVSEEGADCNENQVPDACDIAQDPGIDCDTNGQIDACELNEETDANSNEILDSCEP